MKKRSLLLLFCLLSTTVVLAQKQFEGRIVYRWEFKNPMPAVIPDSMFYESIRQELGGNTYFIGNYFYKKGQYKQEMETGAQSGVQLYVPAQKKIYSWQTGSDTAMWISANGATTDKAEIIRLQETEDVMGIPCRKIIIKTGMITTTYWYNTDVARVDKALFSDHTYGSWNVYLAETGVLPLKYDLNLGMARMLVTATELTPQALSDAEFALPRFGTLLEDPTNGVGK
ncbi:hypothetical protein [Cesiribacter andamanensis]|uniref:DUF4412 domain-containing protein n=1 Tax=Cesiribacter andamanensis AMV16 TaxID=1279009 RepID=M7NAY9_9BACT|nr:hypothetical protein [Cesiribacter andamanensis]EMR04346.1 hypothetical protein ADICEAN_00509 [Cesiribacter andamanensis AMV16]